MSNIDIAQLKHGELDEAADLASKAFISTPLVKVVIRGNGEKQLKGIKKGMKQLLGHPTGDVLTAKLYKQLAGVMRMVKWPDC